jgi:prevent-host-death family protein
MSTKTSTRPISYLKRHTAELVRSVASDGGSVLITQNGHARAVVMDVATYDRWRGALALLKILAHGEADAVARRVVGKDEAFRRARAALKRAADGE